jgi:hypothetical protein
VLSRVPAPKNPPSNICSLERATYCARNPTQTAKTQDHRCGNRHTQRHSHTTCTQRYCDAEQQSGRVAEWQRDRETERQRDRETERQRDRATAPRHACCDMARRAEPRSRKIECTCRAHHLSTHTYTATTTAPDADTDTDPDRRRHRSRRRHVVTHRHRRTGGRIDAGQADSQAGVRAGRPRDRHI